MNLWAQFKKLNPDAPLLVGTVTAINADGSRTLTLIDGGTLTARGGDVPVGGKAFVRGGVIESAAPELEQLDDIEV